MDHRRQSGSRREEFVPGNVDFDGRPGRGPDPDAAAVRSELDRIVHHELEQLPDKYRLPLAYAALEELDYATIGAMLKVRPGTVKTLVFRGKLLLKERVNAALDMKRRREPSNVG